MPTKQYALIVAGGSGKRMNSDVPKQFLPLSGKPVLMHTLERFWAFSRQIELILVLPERQFEFWQQLCTKHDFRLPHRLAKGGEERFFSVKNGLEMIENEGLVAIHDGVRPLVNQATIQKAFALAAKKGTAVPVVLPIDSLRRVIGLSNQAIERNDFRLVQTPQVFDVSMLKKAYLQAYSPRFTDDASVVEAAGFGIQLSEGNRENIKITTSFDMLIAEALLYTKPL